MKIAIVGCGAMGCVYAALFSEAGHEVWAIDTWCEHVAAMRTVGLRIEGASGDRIVSGIQAQTDPAQAGACDLVIVATKASGVESAAKSIEPLLGPETPVITIQNGLGAGERIARHLDPSRIILGVAEAFGASMQGPAHVHHNSMKMIRLGEIDGGPSDRLSWITDTWSEAGFTAAAFDDINQLVWEKFICNVAFSAPCTMFARTMGEVIDDPASWHVAAQCALEAYDAGRAMHIAIGYDDPVAYVREFGERMPGARPSMYLDHLARRRSEIDFINGMVPVVARRAGTGSSYNEMVSAAVRAREATFD